MYEEYFQAISRDHLLEHIRRMTRIAPERLSGSEEERSPPLAFTASGEIRHCDEFVPHRTPAYPPDAHPTKLQQAKCHHIMTVSV